MKDDKNINKRRLFESFSSIPNLQSRLSKQMVAILNKSSGGTDSWSINSDWQGAYDVAESVDQINALIEIYIQIACPSWGCALNQLDPGKDIIIKLIDELGFYEDENPYIGFIKTFYSMNKDYILGEDDWIKLNDWGANDTISNADLKGTGLDRKNHLIFNVNLYKENDGNDADKYIELYRLLSDKNEVLSLNVYAIATYDGSPYEALKGLTKDGSRGTGVYQGGDFREVRNTIFYIVPSKPLGSLHTLRDISNAYKVGKETHFKSEADELATGSSQIDLRRMVSDTVKQVNKVLKTVTKQLNQQISNYANSNPKSTKGIEQFTNKANSYLQDDKQVLQKYVDRLKTSRNKKEYDAIQKELANYVDKNLKVKKLLKNLNVELSSSDEIVANRNTKRQGWSERDLKQAVDNLSIDEKKALVRYLRELGLIK